MVIEVETCSRRDAIEERLHVFERIDGDADFSYFAWRERVIGIHADLRGQIEGDGEAVSHLAPSR